MSETKRTDAAMAQGRLMYLLELARGSSHIASTRTPETPKRVITESWTTSVKGTAWPHGVFSRHCSPWKSGSAATGRPPWRSADSRRQSMGRKKPVPHGTGL